MFTIPLLVCLSLGQIPQDEAEVVFADGKTVKGSIIALDEGQVRLVGNDEPIRLNALAEIRFPKKKLSPPSSKFSIHGQEGLSLKASQFELNKDVLTFLNASRQKIASVNRNVILSIQLDAGIEATEWKRVLSSNLKADALVVKRDKRLDVIEGVIKTLNNESVGFQSSDRLVSINTSKLAGLLFFKGTQKTSQPKIFFTDTDGNQFGGASAKLSKDSLEIKSANDFTIQIPFDRVFRIDYSKSNFVFLDTLNPVFQSWEPFVRANVNDPEIRKLIQDARNRKKAWSRNQSFGSPLMIDQQGEIDNDNLLGRRVFSKGIAIRGGSRIAFDIPENTESLLAEIGIQASDRNMGTVDVVIQIDGKDTLKKRITSELETAFSLSIPCPGDRISFQVGYGGDNDIGDIIVLGDARFKLKQ